MNETPKAILNDPDYLRHAANAVADAAATGPVTVDPDIADHMGAFEEDALSETDALDSMTDGLSPTDDEADEWENAHE